MGEQTYTVQQIIDRQDELKMIVKELSAAINAIRPGIHWEEGIEKDERTSIKLLLPAYKTAKKELEDFTNTTFVMGGNYYNGGL